MIVISGANNGLGLELTKLFIEKKFCVLAVSKHNNNLVQLMKNDNLYVIKGNLNNKSVIRKIGKFIKKNKCNVKMLINNVGFSCVEKTPYINYRDARKIIDTNLLSIMYLTDVILELKMYEKIHVINVLSSVAYKGNINAIYTVSKWGLRGYTECLKEMYKGSTGVVFSNVVPCAMNTSYWDNKPRTIDRTSFADVKLVAQKIYEHLFSNKKSDDLIIKKDELQSDLSVKI